MFEKSIPGCSSLVSVAACRPLSLGDVVSKRLTACQIEAYYTATMVHQPQALSQIDGFACSVLPFLPGGISSVAHHDPLSKQIMNFSTNP